MPTKKAAKTAIPNVESLVVHSNLCNEVAEFLQNRPYLNRQDDSWDELSDLVTVFLRGLKDVHFKYNKADGAAPEHLFDWTALHVVSRLDEDDINLDRLEAVRALVATLLCATPEAYAQAMLGLSGAADPRIDEILAAVTR